MDRSVTAIKSWIPMGVLTLCTLSLSAQTTSPSIMLNAQEISAVRRDVKKYPLLEASWKQVLKTADKAIRSGIQVPVPADDGGGQTHEQHRRNYLDMQACGYAYMMTGNAAYARFVQLMLEEYAAQYRSWGRHPKRKEDPGGKMFWQNLNDCVWMVYTIQAYDAVYTFIPPQKRKWIEENLFAPVVEELSVINGEIFNKIHNHGTWSAAAVGMAGYVCNRPDWVQKALMGTDESGKSGFLAQMKELFSPDGYYAEGPYYQRYAILPFMLFAKAIHRYEPKRNIFAFRDSLLKKAVFVALQNSYTNKVFFPYNDAIKDKTYESEELIFAVNIAYADMNGGAELLDIAQQQNRVILSGAGWKVAKDLAEGKNRPFVYRPMWIGDGPNGDQGGVGLLRAGGKENHTAVVFKAASQGMGHGHFDRLNLLYYNQGGEVFSDYGAARFLNIETKNGGRYTKENDTWAKQTIAHNTVVVDSTSHFKGNLKAASASAPEMLFFQTNQQMQVAVARESKAYSDVVLTRMVALFQPEGLESGKDPLVISFFHLKGKKNHVYDLPFWYQGDLTHANLSWSVNADQLSAWGSQYGYQHLWKLASGKFTPTSSGGGPSFTVLQHKKFYTTSFAPDPAQEFFLVKSGANDPSFNIRWENAFLCRTQSAGSAHFFSITEPHGNTNPVSELVSGAKTSVSDLKIISTNEEETILQFRYQKKNYRLTIKWNNRQNMVEWST